MGSMGKFIKGQPRPAGAGRKPGSKNKSTLFGAEFILAFLTEYRESGQMSQDWMDLEPRDRVALAERMMNYVMPKRAAVQAEVNATVTDRTVEETLNELAGQ